MDDTKVNCSTWPGLEVDPDIAGTGVIIGFAPSAYITLAIVIAHYLVNHENIQNPIDKALVKRLMSQGMIQSTERHSKKQNKALEAALITFSDTQVITGISILLAGYIQLPFGISACHWQVVIALAWFSSLTHLLTLKSLRDYFRERVEMAVWRAVLMWFVMILLVVALGTTGYIAQADSLSL